MRGQSIEPTQLVIELRAGGRIAVGQIQATDQYSVDCRLDVAAVRIIWIPRQAAPRFCWRFAARKYSDAVPALLAMPDRALTGFPDRGLGKFIVRRLQFLQAGDVWLCFGELAHQHRKAAIDAIHVEGRDLHRSAPPFSGRTRLQDCEGGTRPLKRHRVASGLWAAERGTAPGHGRGVRGSNTRLKDPQLDVPWILIGLSPSPDIELHIQGSQ